MFPLLFHLLVFMGTWIGPKQLQKLLQSLGNVQGEEMGEVLVSKSLE